MLSRLFTNTHNEIELAAQKKREAIHDGLMHTQNGLLMFSCVFLMMNGLSTSTITTGMLGFYLEILASKYYEKIKNDPTTAQYLTENYSTVTKYCAMFNTVAQPMAQHAYNKTLKPMVAKIDELTTVPSSEIKKSL